MVRAIGRYEWSFVAAAKLLAVAALMAVLQALSPSGGALAQTVTSFDGDHGPGREVCRSATPPIHCDRAEMDVATNGKQVVQVTWQNVNVYDTAGKLLKSTPLAALIGTTGLDPDAKKDAGPFEPHIVYNEFIERWIITVTCRNDCTLVSAGADATGEWGGTYLSCLHGGQCPRLPHQRGLGPRGAFDGPRHATNGDAHLLHHKPVRYGTMQVDWYQSKLGKFNVCPDNCERGTAGARSLRCSFASRKTS